jgi:acetyl-CoA acetyltransferase
MEQIVIVAAARTPVGSFNGAFANTPAHVLGAVAIQAAISRAGIDPSDVDEVILGARPRTPPASPTPKPPSASTSSAARACAPSPSPPNKSRTAKARSSSPAARKT